MSALLKNILGSYLIEITEELKLVKTVKSIYGC